MSTVVLGLGIFTLEHSTLVKEFHAQNKYINNPYNRLLVIKTHDCYYWLEYLLSSQYANSKSGRIAQDYWSRINTHQRSDVETLYRILEISARCSNTATTQPSKCMSIELHCVLKHLIPFNTLQNYAQCMGWRKLGQVSMHVQSHLQGISF